MGTGSKASEVKIEWSSNFTPPLRLLGVDMDSFDTWLYSAATDVSFPSVLNLHSSIMSYKWSSPYNGQLKKQMTIKRLTWTARVSVNVSFHNVIKDIYVCKELFYRFYVYFKFLERWIKFSLNHERIILFTLHNSV